MKILILVTAITLSLSACNAPKPKTMPARSSTSVEASIIDTNLTTKVKRALLDDNELKSLDITVATTKGDVRLSGVAENQTQIEYTTELTQKIDGVHAVHNKLTAKK